MTLDYCRHAFHKTVWEPTQVWCELKKDGLRNLRRRVDKLAGNGGVDLTTVAAKGPEPLSVM